jgi:glycerol-3-phosphate dehydrogenase (NAD(P)+)
MQRIGVIGGGAWGTALAQLAAQNGRRATLWAREAEVVEAINAEHRNPLFLPDVPLDPSLRATTELAEAAQADALLLVAPAQHLGSVAAALAPHVADATPAVICAKGVELGSFRLMSEAAAAALPQSPLAVLSGPTFAHEVAKGLPTAVTLACADAALGHAIMGAIGRPTFRPYLSDDLIGAQIGGAVKNVIAIACGVVEGRGLGDNARAALMTRGMAEMLRYGRARGAKAETLMGLCGLGDLTLTCNNDVSRNFSLGIELGEGRPIADILGGRRSVAEGVASASAIVEHSLRLDIELPICTAVDGVCNHFAELGAVIDALLARPFKTETE